MYSWDTEFKRITFAKGEEYMAKAKAPVIPLEELTTEELVAKALHYEEMAGNMMMYQWQNRYYTSALKIWKRLFNDEAVPEARQKYRELKKVRAEVLARGCIQDYREACRLRDEAKNDDQTRIAVQHFTTLAEYFQKHTIQEELLEADLAEELSGCLDAADQAKLVQAKMDRKGTKRVTRNISVLVVLAALAVGAFLFSKTASFQYAVGKAESMAGMSTRAWARYKTAWQMSGREDWKEVYLTTRYADGVAAYEAGDYETAYSDFKKMVTEEDYLDSEEYLTKTELALIAEAELGSKVRYADEDWDVLDRDGSRCLLIRNSSLPDQSFTSDGTWESASVRTWLNSTYLEENFLAAEIDAICETEVKTADNAEYGTPGGAVVTDRVFILSLEEFEQYRDILKTGKKIWWLRTPGANVGTFCIVSPDRAAITYGMDPSEATIRIRPVFWVDTAE